MPGKLKMSGIETHQQDEEKCGKEGTFLNKYEPRIQPYYKYRLEEDEHKGKDLRQEQLIPKPTNKKSVKRHGLCPRINSTHSLT